MIILRLIDKIVFAALLILMLQVPIVTDHYVQYLNGYVDATQAEVDHYQQLADTYGYTDINSMLTALQANQDALVRDDAQHKQTVMQAHKEAQQALKKLRTSNYFEQAWYFAQPAQYQRLGQVLNLYQPSLPLKPQTVGSALITSFSLYLLLWLPVALLRHRRKKHRQVLNH
tara:strand:- start:28 stop:543 length:516 start_codon:yes stop_codon:yes gene_type:complete